jgi:RsiW-degrading membrane proteinase PrsW (M82 family)
LKYRWSNSILKAFLLCAFLLGTHSAWADNGGLGEEGPSPIILSVVLLVAILGIGSFALVWQYRYRYEGKDSFSRYAFRNPLVLLVISTLVIIAGVNAFAPNPWTGSPHQQAEYAKLRRMPGRAAHSYRQLAEQYPFIAEYHYQYVSSYYECGDWANTGSIITSPDPWNAPFPFYQGLLRDWTPGMRDMAHLGLGILNYHQYMRNLSREHLLDISDTTISYRNLFLGFLAEGAGELAAANRYYRQELEYGGAQKKAVRGLVRLKMSYDRDDLEGIFAMMNDKQLGPLVPESLRRYYYVREGSLGPYFASITTEWWSNAGLIGVMGALLGLLLWVFFLRRIDIFRRPVWAMMVGAVVLGGIFCFAAFPVYDMLKYELHFDLTGQFSHDFLYCVFGIGVVEELVKFIPLSLMLIFLGKNARPLDYVMYGSLSALGFAFVENIFYINDGSVSIIHGRVLISVVFHMFATSTVAFGMVLGRFRFPKYRIPLIIVFFFFAALLHGIYDFWLLNPVASGFYFFAYVIFVYATFQYAAYLNNCLNNSPVFRGRVVLNTIGLAQYLLVGLVAVLLFEYIALSFAYGSRLGNYALVSSMGMGSFLMFFVVLNLSFIDVVQGEWFVIRFWNFGNRVNYNAAIGKRIRLHPLNPGSVLQRALPAEGEIIARVRVNNSNQYFLVEFSEPIDFHGSALPYVLVRAKGRDEVIEPGNNMEVAVVAFRDRESLMRIHKRKKDFRLLDYAILN